jgi:hypothetical protein
MQPTPQSPTYSQQAAPQYQPPQLVTQPAPYANAPQEQFRFRPLDQQPTTQEYQQPPVTSSYPQTQAGAGYYNSPTPSANPQGYQQQPQVTVDPSMKFRPLDQPGYSQ